VAVYIAFYTVANNSGPSAIANVFYSEKLTLGTSQSTAASINCYASIFNYDSTNAVFIAVGTNPNTTATTANSTTSARLHLGPFGTPDGPIRLRAGDKVQANTIV